MKLLDLILSFQQLLNKDTPETPVAYDQPQAENTVHALTLSEEHKDTNHMALKRIKEAMLYLDKEHHLLLRVALHYIEAKMIVDQTQGNRSIGAIINATVPHLEDDTRKVVSAMMTIMDLNRA